MRGGDKNPYFPLCPGFHMFNLLHQSGLTNKMTSAAVTYGGHTSSRSAPAGYEFKISRGKAAKLPCTLDASAAQDLPNIHHATRGDLLGRDVRKVAPPRGLALEQTCLAHEERLH